MKKRLVGLLLCGILAAAALTACGSKDDGKKTESSEKKDTEKKDSEKKDSEKASESEAATETAAETEAVSAETEGVTGTESASGTESAAVDPSVIVGSFTFSQMLNTSTGESMDPDEYAQSVGVEDPKTLYTTYVFAEDGTVNCNIGGDDNPGTYTFDGKNAEITMNGQTFALEYDAEKDMFARLDDETGLYAIFMRLQ